MERNEILMAVKVCVLCVVSVGWFVYLERGERGRETWA